MGNSWRVAKSLLKLREQINHKYPNRSKISDGTIGDARHAARPGDHNPNAQGVVTAMDITHDPEHGVDTYKLAEHLRTTRDLRIKYVISDGRIFNSTVVPWQWRAYGGTNKHTKHIHISVVTAPALYDNDNPWLLPGDVVLSSQKSAPPIEVPVKNPAQASSSCWGKLSLQLINLFRIHR